MMMGKKLIFGLLISYCFSIIAIQDQLNILFVVHYFPSLSQIYIVNLMTSLIDRGHNVSIFSVRKNEVHENLPPNIEKYRLLDRVTYENFPDPLPDADIVFCQFGGFGKTVFEIPNLSEWLQQRKVVVCLRGLDIVEYSKNDSFVNKKIFEQVDLFLPVCDYFKQQLLSLGCPLKKIAVHHSVIDCAQFFFRERIKPIKDNVIEFISVCRLVKKKGLDYALQAIAKVAQKYPHIHYTIVGDGPEYKNLKDLTRQLKLQKKVTFCGWKDHKAIVSLLDKSHIFLLPSITPKNGNKEGIANSLKEAMAMGLISIGTLHAGTPELIDNGVSGFLVPEKDVSELVRIIHYIIKHPEEWKSWGRAARKKIEDEFEIKKSAEKLERLFYNLLGRPLI